MPIRWRNAMFFGARPMRRNSRRFCADAFLLAVVCTAGNGIAVAGESPDNDWRQTKQNLRWLSLAMHNYHDVYNHFPPAVVVGPDGKTPHSWRVELLPFLQQERIYHHY